MPVYAPTHPSAVHAWQSAGQAACGTRLGVGTSDTRDPMLVTCRVCVGRLLAERTGRWEAPDLGAAADAVARASTNVLRLTDTQRIAVSLPDSRGWRRPPTWVTTDPTVATLQVAADGCQAEVIACQPGEAQIRVTGDDSVSGPKTAAFDVVVEPSEATRLQLRARIREAGRRSIRADLQAIEADRARREQMTQRRLLENIERAAAEAMLKGAPVAEAETRRPRRLITFDD